MTCIFSRRALWFFPLLAVFAQAQTCGNYGTPTGSDCLCPVGFGGTSCLQPSCGGTIFQGSKRPLVPASGQLANLTAADCSCSSGWTGTGCNVCQTPSACQTGFAAVSSASPTPSIDSGKNDIMVCNTQSRVYASSQMSCTVDNPTLHAIYPKVSTLNIIRTLKPSLSPVPNATSFGDPGTAFAQLFYDGVEQFYCRADSCAQEFPSSTPGASNWQCSNLHCTCVTNATFCGSGSTNLTSAINSLVGTLSIECGAVGNSANTATCYFKQDILQTVFGASGLELNGCIFGECVRQNVIDTTVGSSSTSTRASKSLSSGVIAGLAVVCGLVFLSLLLLALGLRTQRLARKTAADFERSNVGVEWSRLSYVIPSERHGAGVLARLRGRGGSNTDDRVILDSVSGSVKPGQMMAILGPSGAGKTTLVEILAGKNKSGTVSGHINLVSQSSDSKPPPRVGFVAQQDVLPSTLTVFEALLFAARLRLPESINDQEKKDRVNDILQRLGIAQIKDMRIGDVTGGKARGISGGEMRRVTIGLELIADPDILLLDEPTSGLDSVSAAKVADVLHAIAHDPVNPTPVIVSIHQPSSQLYQKFDLVLLLSHGRALYSGPGSFAPTEYFSTAGAGTVPAYQQGYNVAEYLLEIASDPPLGLFQTQGTRQSLTSSVAEHKDSTSIREKEKAHEGDGSDGPKKISQTSAAAWRSGYATTFLTQLQYLCGREWKILKRDKTLFLTHVIVAALLGIFCGGLYFQTGITIAGFQSRVGCLFFLGALIAFSSLSALYNVAEVRPLFLQERSSGYYSPTAWLLARFFFDVVPLRLIPTIIVSTIVYWMAGLSPAASNFFKYLLILSLYSLAMTLYNFLLGTLFQNAGVAILISALSALYQMTFAGFFVHLNDIPAVLRWLQWLCPLKYTLEALSVNEVGSGLMIEDTLQGVPVNVSASMIMQLLFGFGVNNYYRDVLITVGFILAFGVGVIGVVWIKVRERR